MSSSTSTRFVRNQRRLGISASVLLFIFLLLGGGGAPAPLVHAVHQVLAALGLAALAWFHLFVQPLRHNIRWAGLFLVLILLVPVIQLIPLPYELWRGLPGREFAAQALSVSAIAPHWRPISLDPEATKFAALSLLPGIFAFIAVACMDFRQRNLVVRLVLAVALISATVGALQTALPGTRSLYLFPRSIFTASSGIFANRNFQSDLMLVAILLAAWLARAEAGRIKTSSGSKRGISFALVLIPFFALLVLATQSKTGAVLLLPVLGLAALITFGEALRKSHIFYAVTGTVAVAAAVLLLTPFGAGVAGRFVSFDLNADSRSQSLPDVFLAIDQYFPVGSGLGTFDYVYRSVETLTNVKQTYFNHAHNDYLEVLLETGLLGTLLVAAFLVILLIRSWHVWKSRTGSRRNLLQRVSAAAIVLIVLHSAGDYPLRTVTMMTLFALLCAFLFTDPLDEVETDPTLIRAGSESRQRHKAQRLGGAALFLLVGGWLAFTALSIGLARQLAQARAGTLAYAVRPSNSRAAALASNLTLLSGNTARAVDLARQAVKASPIDAVALRTLAEALDRTRPGAGDDLMVMAARLTWRDRPTQIWVIERALRVGELQVTADRVEALARLNTHREVVYSISRLLALDPAIRSRLVRSLAARPLWRQGFLLDGSPKTPHQLEALAQILERLRATGAPPSMAEARATIDELVQINRPQRAYRLYVTLFGTGATAASLLSDSGFDRRDTDYTAGQNNTMFDWRVHASGRSEAGVEDDSERRGNRVLYAISGEGPPVQILSRLMALPAGRYRLHYTVRADQLDGPEGFHWSVRCEASGPPLAEQRGARLESSGWQRRGFEFVIPPAGCPAQMITLATMTGGKEAVYDEVRVERIGR